MRSAGAPPRADADAPVGGPHGARSDGAHARLEAAGCALVVFDCDGVLVDSERLSQGVLRQMLAELGLSLSLEETMASFSGTSMDACLAAIAGMLGRSPPDHFVDEFARRTGQAFRAHLQPVPGVRELVTRLTVPTCVASNGPRAKVELTLTHTGLWDLFAGRIFTADDVPRPKPAPDLFLHASRQMGVAPVLVTVVEDTATGIAAAKSAGMRAIGFAGTTPAARLLAAGADAIAATTSEVGALLALR
jgi:HAD superfamily hydrolase (TIGR01509 family)